MSAILILSCSKSNNEHCTCKYPQTVMPRNTTHLNTEKADTPMWTDNGYI